MAKRGMVLLGLSGPVTQPTSEVPGGVFDGAGCAAAGAGAGACWAAAGVCEFAVPGDGGPSGGGESRGIPFFLRWFSS